MSVSIEKSKIPNIDEVLQQLTLKPKPTFRSQKYNKFWYIKKKKEDGDSSDDDDSVINFYVDFGSTIKLPYAFATQLTHVKSNSWISHPDVYFNFIQPLYEIQEDPAMKALNELNSKGSTILNLHTGSGKTVIGAFLAAKMHKLTLILIASTVLIPQWQKTFIDFTDAKVWIVGEEPPPFAHIIVCMDTRFSKLPSSYLQSIGTIIIDEAHQFCTSTRAECLLGCSPAYVIAMTATLERKNGMHSMIHAICGPESIRKISTKPFNVYRYNTGISVPTKLTRTGDVNWPDITSKLCESKERNSLIIDLIRNNPGFKILVLTWLVEHVEFLSIQLSMLNENVDFMAGNKKSYTDSRILIGTISKIGTGFDEKTACQDWNGFRLNILILVGSMKNRGLLEQVAGRVFRSEFPQIIHFVDDMKISENHWNEGQKWYKSRNGTIINFDSKLVLEKRKIEANKVNSANAQLAFLQLAKPTG